MSTKTPLVSLSLVLVTGLLSLGAATSRGAQTQVASSPYLVAQQPIPTPTTLVEQLKSPSAPDVSAAFNALVAQQEAALPALETCLPDPEARFACVEVLTRLPAEHATPILLNAIKDAAGRDPLFTSFIAGALGRLKSSEAVPLLETLYQAQSEATGRLALSLAWALEAITGKRYGPAFDPWRQGKSPISL